MGSGFTPATVVTIDGSPVAATFVDAHTLTVALPAGLRSGRHAVVAADAGGFASLAPRVLVVGHSLYLPAVTREMPGDTASAP